MDIKEKIEKILEELIPGIDLSSENLMEEEGVHSLTIVHLIAELDIAFDIEISFEDIAENNFSSVESLVNMVKKHLE